jgi:hypothetical protein
MVLHNEDILLLGLVCRRWLHVTSDAPFFCRFRDVHLPPSWVLGKTRQRRKSNLFNRCVGLMTIASLPLTIGMGAAD